MKRKEKLIFALFYIFLNFPTYIKTSEKINFYDKKIPLEWRKLSEHENFLKKEIIWEKSEFKNFNTESFQNDYLNSSNLDIKAIGTAVSVNGSYFPEISHYVPNGFVEDPRKLISTNLRTISRLRFCKSKNFDPKCADGLNVDFNLINKENLALIQNSNCRVSQIEVLILERI